MNTMTHEENTAVANASATVVRDAAPDVSSPAPDLRHVPLSRLGPSARNVRQSGGTSIAELAASIARVGLLHNLVVVPSADGEHCDVIAGQRRFAALKLLAKRRKLPKDHPVLCLVVTDAAARTVSLTENVQREAMHPAEQFAAFAALVAEGRAIEDIAADFGVTPLVVRRRLKLANLSPRLLADYRADAVTLDQLMALAITDDHAAQEAAFYDAPHWQRSPDALRAQLTHDEIDAARDALAKFVGIDAYVAAGGVVRRDLFADEQRGVYLGDAALLERLARDKLAAHAEGVQVEGWRWVEVVPRATHAELHQFQRAKRDRRQPTKAETKRVAKLESEQQALQDRLDDEDTELSDEEAKQVDARLDEVASELELLDEALTSYGKTALARSGAVVCVDHAGAVIVHRGLIRAEDAPKTRGRSSAPDGDEDDAAGSVAPGPRTASLSEKLVRRLSAHRTAALQAEVARHPHIALVAVVHRIASRVICDGYEGSVINISATSHVDGLVTHAPDIGDAPAAIGLREVREAWASRLPTEADALFAELLAMPQSQLLSLLAVGVASTVGAICSRETERPARLLASALGLDMHDWWTPTAAGYFEHVSKAKALEAVQVFAPDQVTRLAKLKKADLASEAERLAAGSGWLPAMLAASDANDVGDAARVSDFDEEASDVEST